jgi:hypothetical protein
MLHPSLPQRFPLFGKIIVPYIENYKQEFHKFRLSSHFLFPNSGNYLEIK